MEQQYQHTSSVDYSLKEGEKLVLQIKNVSTLKFIVWDICVTWYLNSCLYHVIICSLFFYQQKSGRSTGSRFFELGLNNLSLEEKVNKKEPVIALKPPPAPLSPVVSPKTSPPELPSKLSLLESSEAEESVSPNEQSKESASSKNQNTQDTPDDDFGDFQAAGWYRNLKWICFS